MANNNTFAVESFINWCDEMMIAEEGLIDKIKNKNILKIKKTLKQYHLLKKRLKIIQTQINL